jgi:hypothetical protein
MITASDSAHTVDLGAYYAILPSGHTGYTVQDYCERMGGKPVASGFSYDSSSNTEFLSVPQLRALIEHQIDQPSAAH